MQMRRAGYAIVGRFGKCGSLSSSKGMFYMEKISRDKLHRLIHENGGPQGLNLRHADLSNEDLEGINLSGAIFGNDDPRGERACLKNTRFSRAKLDGVDFLRVDLSGANFFDADLQNADFRWADLSNTNFRGADLRSVNFYRSKAHGTDFWQSDMSNSDLFMASFDSQTHLPSSSLGEKLLQEREGVYRNFLHQFLPKVTSRNPDFDLKDRYLKASQIYLRLKSVFLANGQYSDASWAYFKERQMRRKAIAPWSLMNSFGFRNERAQYTNDSPKVNSLQYTLRWLFDLTSEYSCGYGERPYRAAFFSFGIIIIFAFLFRFVGGITSSLHQMTWLDYLVYSLATFTTIGFETYKILTPVAQVLTSVEAFMGICMLALVMFALGNRINRA